MLKGPTEEDVKKIHAEVNQIGQQRFLIISFALTIFGVISSWIIPKSAPLTNSPVGLSCYIGSIILTFLLFALFWYSHLLKKMLRIFTSYLSVTGKSSWEDDWQLFRKDKHFAYTKGQCVFFLLMGILSTLYPCIIANIYSLSYEPKDWFWINNIVGIVYCIFVVAIGFLDIWDFEQEAKDRWEQIKNSPK